jgi:hypothetical protein
MLQPMPMKLAPSPMVENPKQTFESALALIAPPTGLGTSSIASRRRPIARVPGAQPVEKRALTDAARALARLWNLSPNLVR